MTRRYRMADESDAKEHLALTEWAYEPIRRLGIHFAAAHADLDLVLNNIRKNACYVMEEDGRIIATVSIRMPWGQQPGPYGVPHIWWFAVDPASGTADKHPWLIDMYERKGYVRSGEQDLGKGHITVYMKKQLRTDL